MSLYKFRACSNLQPRPGTYFFYYGKLVRANISIPLINALLIYIAKSKYMAAPSVGYGLDFLMWRLVGTN